VGLPIDAVLFDFSGVLTRSPMHSFAEAAARAGIDVRLFVQIACGFGSYDDGSHPWHQLERGEIEVDDYDRRIREIAAAAGVTEFPGLPDLDSVVSADDVRHDMIDLVRRVRASGRRTAVVTNNVRDWVAWRQLVPADAFDLIVDSSEVGMRKPEARIYRHTAAALGVEPSGCVFLDDLAINVAGAVEVGMTGIVVDDTGRAAAELGALLGW
jgi:putative hydrolase of the HAD superfamily